MAKSKKDDKKKPKQEGIAVHENPRDGFENYRTGTEIYNQVAADDLDLPV